MEIKEQITKLLDDLNKGVYEKQEVIALSLLSAIAGESIFLLGEPGVAKSLIARRLKFGFKDGTSFEYLMNRFSTPDEIFGPVSISKLKDEDKYERIIKNYLPSATVVFLDEIWKAGPSIQNALLTVLNEKVYRNGDQEIKVPMKALISASNELPMKGQGLEALWDRFLVRFVVGGITDKANFNDMVSKSLNSYDDNVSVALKLTDDQYGKISAEIDKVEIPENVFNVIHIIRSYIDNHNEKDEKQENRIYISDRRWRKIVRLLRTSAFLNDRKEVDLMDCFLIAHCIWNEPTQFQTALQFVKEAISKWGYQPKQNPSELKEHFHKEIVDDVASQTYEESDTRKRVPQKVGDEWYQILYRNDESRKIKISDFNDLITTPKSVKIYSFNSSYEYNNFNVSSGSDFCSIIIEGTQFKINSKVTGKKVIKTKEPHKPSIKYWDEKTKYLLETTKSMKEEIKSDYAKDLEHLDNNLFVDRSYSKHITENLDNTILEIEKIELSILEQQKIYKQRKTEEYDSKEEFIG